MSTIASPESTDYVVLDDYNAVAVSRRLAEEDRRSVFGELGVCSR